jgi:hypothetical protein
MPLTLRKLTFQEAPVIAAVERAREQVGLAQGAALFNVTANMSAAPSVIPRAVDIIRNGMGTAMEQAVAKGYAQGMRDGMGAAIQQALAKGHAEGVVEMTFEKSSKRSGAAKAIQEVSDSLRRLGVSS